MNTIWVVDDDASIRWVLAKALTAADYRVESFDNAESALEAAQQACPDAMLVDIRMPGMSGLDLAKTMQHRQPGLPVIVMTAHTDLDSALASYESGAFEYLPKPFDIDDALALVRRAVQQRQEQVPAGRETQGEMQEIIGEAPAMQEVFRAIGRLAKSHINVLISGESGTGKELVARALHRHSPRADRAFVAINTAAIPAELLESELFGHEKGAFTGAHDTHAGRFEQADGGTLFLDEIGDMPPDLQTRLLRVLSEKRFYRVGGRRQLEVDVRVLAATNRDLERRVAEGKFREDLYHRLNVIRIYLPALRERREDIPLLARHFLERSAVELDIECKQLDSGAMKCLTAHDWKGNVRQMENMCRWITVMAPGKLVSADDLPPDIHREPASIAEDDWALALRRTVKRKLNQGQQNILRELGPSFESALLEVALEHTQGHRQKAARSLGWGRNTLTRKLKELNITPKRS